MGGPASKRRTRSNIKPHSKARFAKIKKGNGVKFVYADSPDEALKHRYVIYWQYDKRGNKLNLIQHPFYEKLNIMMPVGYGITNFKGELMPARFKPYPVKKDASNPKKVSYHVKGGADPKYFSSAYGGSHPHYYKLISLGPGAPYPGYSATKFDPSRKVGFMLMPSNTLRSFESKDVLELGKTDSVWVGKVTKDKQIIKLPCTLPEWDHRLEKKVRALELSQNFYAKTVKKHLEYVSMADNISMLVQFMLRYPPKPQSLTNITKAKGMVTELENLKKSILEEFAKNTNCSTPCGKALKLVDKKANALWALLKKKELVQEVKRYMPYFKDTVNPKMRGPHTLEEINWAHIFSTCERAYDALSKSNLADTVYREHVTPALTYLVAISEKYPQGMKVSSEFLQGLNATVQKPTGDEADTPLVVAIDLYTRFAPQILGNSPGPPSLLVGVINSFGMYVSRVVMSSNNPVQEAGRLMRVLLGLAKIFNGGRELDMAKRVDILYAAFNGNLAKGRQTLTELCTKSVRGRSVKLAGKVFKSSMLIFAAIGFAASITSDDSSTLRKWAAIVGSGSSLALTSIGILLSKHAASLAFRLTTSTLAIVGCIACTIISVVDAIEAFREGDMTKGVLSIVSGGGSIVLMVGFVLMEVGIGTSWAGIGLVLVIVGLITTIGASLWLFLRDVFTENTEQAFNAFQKRFSREGGLYDTVYKKIPKIESCYQGIIRSAKMLDWWEMSWRAIVPLYCSGYVAYRKGTSTIDLLDTAQIIEKFIDNKYETGDVGSYKVVIQYLSLFERSKKNPLSDVDKDGLPDWIEWINGTFWAKREPYPLKALTF